MEPKNFSLTGVALLCLGLGGCGLEMRKDGEVNDVTLTRIFAPVDRYNCAGQLISSETEEVGEPSEWVRIEADDTSIEVHEAEVNNLSLNRTGGGMLSYGRSSVSFPIHMSNVLLAYQVKDGLNEFEYKFYSDEATESPRESYETGIILINVTYEQKWETEKREIRPTVEECMTPPDDGNDDDV